MSSQQAKKPEITLHSYGKDELSLIAENVKVKETKTIRGIEYTEIHYHYEDEYERDVLQSYNVTETPAEIEIMLKLAARHR